MLITTSVLVNTNHGTFNHFTIGDTPESVFVNCVVLFFLFVVVRSDISFVNAPVKIIMS